MDISIVLSKSIQTLLPSDIQRNEPAMCNGLMKLYMYTMFTYEHICMYICMYVCMYICTWTVPDEVGASSLLSLGSVPPATEL